MGSQVPRLKFLESSFSGNLCEYITHLFPAMRSATSSACPQFPLLFFFFPENEVSPAGKTRFCFRCTGQPSVSRQNLPTGCKSSLHPHHCCAKNCISLINQGGKKQAALSFFRVDPSFKCLIKVTFSCIGDTSDGCGSTLIRICLPWVSL